MFFNFLFYLSTGLVVKVYAKKVNVEILHKHERRDDLYLWPQKADKQPVMKEDVLYIIKEPPQLVDRKERYRTRVGKSVRGGGVITWSNPIQISVASSRMINILPF